MSSINEKLRQIRLELGLTTEQVAVRLGVTHSAVTKWEGKDRPPGVGYAAWAGALGCTVEQVVLGPSDLGRRLDPYDVATIEDLAAALPRMTEREKRALRSQLRAYAEIE